MTRPTDEQIKALRKGDVVTVRGVVSNDNPDSANGDVLLTIESSYTQIRRYVSPSEIMTIEPREIKVGDRVQMKNGTMRGNVRIVERRQVIVLWDVGNFSVCMLSDLERLT